MFVVLIMSHDYLHYACCLSLQANSLEVMALDALISVNEAARRLGGISKWTVHAWLSQGRLQRTKVGARTMIRESELTRVIDEGGKSAAPSRPKEPTPTGAEDYRAKEERLRRERRRRNAPA